MKLLNPEKNLSEFFNCVEESASRALLLDYDGTLAPFTEQRAKAFPYPGVVNVLQDIMQNSNTRLVLISGRKLDDVIPLLGLDQLPEMWGSHGGERLLTDGSYHKTPLAKSASVALQAARDWIDAKGWSDHLENKPLSVALHWRGIRPEKIKDIRAKVLEYLPHLVQGSGLSLQEFDGGMELRPRGVTKAEAVDTILIEIKGNAVAYLGDDLTDEDAFKALKKRGLAVLVRKELRKTEADLWLRPPVELLEFLRRWQTSTSLAGI